MKSTANRLGKAALAFAVATLAALSLTLLPACAQKKVDNRATLVMTSDPEKATVSVSGVEIGSTPITLQVPAREYVFKFEKLNCKPVWEKVVLKEKERRTLEVQLQPVAASIMLVSVPQGAKVECDGKLAGETPSILKDLPAGKHSAVLKKSGYSSKTVEWNIEDARPQLIKVELSSNVGTLRVDSTPSGANLSVDGEQRGHTPFNDRIEQGQHKIRIDKEGFAVFEQVATVNRDKPTSVKAELQILSGSLKISSTPTGATVFLDDAQYGSTPTEIKDLKPGTYKLGLEKAGHDKTVSDITIRPGQHLEIDLAMDSNTGGLDIVANPPGVSIYVDGRLVGSSEADPSLEGTSKLFPVRNLSAGKHALMVAHKRAIPDKKEIEVEVKKGKVERVQPINLWIANTVLKIRGGPTYTGRLVAESDSEIIFEPEPGIRQTYKKEEVVMRKELKEKE